MNPFYLTRYPNEQEPGPILTPRQNIAWESKAVFNPGVVYDNGVFHMLYRSSPAEMMADKPRVNRPGMRFLHNVSRIGYASSTDGIHFTPKDVPFIAPDQDYDRYGCEDPRISKIGDTFYITYTAINRPLEDKANPARVRIALASTKDFVAVKKYGIIGPEKTSKAAAFFTEPVNGGKIALALTISSDSKDSHVAVRYYNTLEQALHPTKQEWKNFLANSQETALLQTYSWLERGPELGAPPIKTDKGWLFVYSSESMASVWTITAGLADFAKPHKLIARTPGYLLQPVTTYEREGIVPNVTFPSAAVIVGDELWVYYGAGDTVIGLATCKLNKLLDYLEQCKNL
jgi:beta-1,2-mannobiose phosphorylase / 1,2-beta-oligomannan phosphorylase